jgi:hypothetical protein
LDQGVLEMCWENVEVLSWGADELKFGWMRFVGILMDFENVSLKLFIR